MVLVCGFHIQILKNLGGFDDFRETLISGDDGVQPIMVLRADILQQIYKYADDSINLIKKLDVSFTTEFGNHTRNYETSRNSFQFFLITL